MMWTSSPFRSGLQCFTHVLGGLAFYHFQRNHHSHSLRWWSGSRVDNDSTQRRAECFQGTWLPPLLCVGMLDDSHQIHQHRLHRLSWSRIVGSSLARILPTHHLVLFVISWPHNISHIHPSTLCKSSQSTLQIITHPPPYSCRPSAALIFTSPHPSSHN